jgi:hypothetical protein
MAAMMAGSPAAVAAPTTPPLVEASNILDFRDPLNVGFFSQPTPEKKDTQDQPRVVKIAQGGYMNALFPQEEVTMDEILRILEGR